MLRISIITVCYNSAETIEATIQSVVSQDYHNLEYIVVDGASTDDTGTILERYKNNITTLISEKDDGIYFAINKGIAAATGDVIAILHADDFYTNSQVISTVMQTFERKKTDTVYGDLQYINRLEPTSIIRNWKAGEFYPALFLKGWMPPHPSFFVKKECYDKHGVYNTQLRSSADYELMLRLLYKYKCSTTYLPEVFVKMRVGGQSNVSFVNRLKANQEDRTAWKLNNLQPSLFTFIRKPLSKLKQFF